MSVFFLKDSHFRVRNSFHGEEKMLKSKRGQKLKEISSRLESWRNEHRKETAHVDAVKAIREVRTRG